MPAFVALLLLEFVEPDTVNGGYIVRHESYERGEIPPLVKLRTMEITRMELVAKGRETIFIRCPGTPVTAEDDLILHAFIRQALLPDMILIERLLKVLEEAAVT